MVMPLGFTVMIVQAFPALFHHIFWLGGIVFNKILLEVFVGHKVLKYQCIKVCRLLWTTQNRKWILFAQGNMLPAIEQSNN